MDISRAQEILRSSQQFDVELDGIGVWIDSVDTVGRTAQVHDLGNPNDTRTVAIDKLKEQ